MILDCQLWILWPQNRRISIICRVHCSATGERSGAEIWVVCRKIRNTYLGYHRSLIKTDVSPSKPSVLWRCGLGDRKGIVVVIVVDRFWHATQDCVAPYVDHILHRDRFWAVSIASGSVGLWNLICCTVPSHVMWGRPRGLLQSSGGRVDRILLASALSSIRAMCPKSVRSRDWTIAVKGIWQYSHPKAQTFFFGGPGLKWSNFQKKIVGYG